MSIISKYHYSRVSTVIISISRNKVEYSSHNIQKFSNNSISKNYRTYERKKERLKHFNKHF